ncbi:hypothetical protein [Tengunoibacter tsumagoiensis]|uniref:Uncharacterized protein n=1 Tax=Tengunoibacter tsumagoiensis TaxID=2014871 RepID=A0A402A9V9_9CHLR|nr:hypothetical protein [Tengunoibacter tsumagoiensis]GCE15806.1 hypothetical protein KTT_56650 [Tengunoibacter tsumagoiensis]
MITAIENSTPKQVRRIGILLGDLGMLNRNRAALQFLVLQMNTLQQTFEYEFLPVDDNDEFIQKFSNQRYVEMNGSKNEVQPFLQNYQKYLSSEIQDYSIKEKTLSSHFILVSMACFDNHHYSMIAHNLAILALGNWKRYMAPPSLIEFILMLIVRESIALVCQPLESSVHLGTRGCLCDFTPFLDEVRLKILNGFICHSCCTTLKSEGFRELPQELQLLLKKDWLGKANEPEKPAGIVAHLGYDLFTTKGLKATWWEISKRTLQEEWLKSLLTLLITVLGAILVGFLVLRLGLSK